jgi:putative ABC transport system permease protein
MFEFAPIIKSLWRKPTGPLLLIIQLAISIAIISNAFAFIAQRHAYVSEDPGFNVEGLIKFTVRQDLEKGLDETITRDLAYLRSLSVIRSATAITGLPLSGVGGTSGVSTEPRQEGVTSTTAVSTAASIVRISEQGIPTLGARILQGRDFNPGEYLRFDRASPPQTGSIVITQALAKTLFPDDKNVLGKIIYESGGGAFTIVGVIEDMFGHFLKWDFPRHVVIFPHLLLNDSIHYLVRVDERAQAEFMNDTARDFRNSNKDRILDDGKTMADIVYSAYAGEHAMIKILSVVLIMLVGVNALGIFGLTSFWVNQRRKHIGIRRALGASRIAIMRYFILENIILVVCAVSLGALAAITTSMYMVKAYSFSALPWIYIPLSGLLVLFITLSAAIVPVRKASYISPVEAVAGK